MLAGSMAVLFGAVGRIAPVAIVFYSVHVALYLELPVDLQVAVQWSWFLRGRVSKLKPS